MPINQWTWSFQSEFVLRFRAWRSLQLARQPHVYKLNRAKSSNIRKLQPGHVSWRRIQISREQLPEHFLFENIKLGTIADLNFLKQLFRATFGGLYSVTQHELYVQNKTFKVIFD